MRMIHIPRPLLTVMLFILCCGTVFAQSIPQATWAQNVVLFQPGSSQGGSDPANALGDTPGTWVRLGDGGNLVLDFGDDWSTSGDSQTDIFVDEFGTPDNFYLCLYPADSFTTNALAGLGWVSWANGTVFQVPFVFNGPTNVDLDMFIPGFAACQLKFTQLMIEDAGSGNGPEIIRVSALVCTNGGNVLPGCAPGYAASVEASMGGANQNSNHDDPTDALGNTPNTRFSMGSGGTITLCFSNVFTTSGGASSDLFVDEYNVPDCYNISVRPANAATAQALQTAGLTDDGAGFYALPQLFCSDENVDLDQFVPGHSALELLFDCVRIDDDGSPGNGAEIVRVRAEIVCDLARLGDRVFADADCDGIQDGNEVGVPGLTVNLLDAQGLNVLAQTVTDDHGNYEFIVPAGAYRVSVSFDSSKFFLTQPGVGNDPAADSDIVPGFDMSEVVTLQANDVNHDVDAGLCLVCTGFQAFVNDNLPSCGTNMDPVMSATLPVIGTEFTLDIQSQFPNALTLVFASLGAPQLTVIPTANCNVWLDIDNLVLLFVQTTDANGNLSITFPIFPDPALEGFEITLQSRICFPAIPSPIPGLPDWPSNAVHLGLGCQ